MTTMRPVLFTLLLIAAVAAPCLLLTAGGQEAASRVQAPRPSVANRPAANRPAADRAAADRAAALPAFGLPPASGARVSPAVPPAAATRPIAGAQPVTEVRPVADSTLPRAAIPLPAEPSPSKGFVETENSMVTLINNVRVPAPVEGLLTAMAVEEGDLVESGQTLAVIDDQQAQLTLMLTKAQEKEAELNALNTVNRRDAEQSEELAREEAAAYADLARQGATPTWEARAKALEANRMKLRIELAVLNEKIAKAQYMGKKSERELAELEVSRRKIVAPFSGFVELRIAQLGEWVQPGSPIVQLVQMDRLRAQGAVSAVDPSSRVTPGMPAVVEFNLGGGRIERINGVVGFVGNDVDISNRRRLWVEFENKRIGNDWLIKPGMVPVIRIDNSRAPEANLDQAAAAGNESL